MRGSIFGALGDHESLIEVTERGLRVQPDSGEAYFNIGLASSRVGRFENAVSAFKQALTLSPESRCIF